MPGRPKILLASQNPGKVRELRSILEAVGAEVVGLDEIDPLGAIAPPVEDGQTFAENARAKAAYYARATGLWALADDSGLRVDALNGAPGTRSARYAADRLPQGAERKEIDAANNRKLLAALEQVDDARRTGRFVCHLALSDGRDVLIEATGTFEGQIGRFPAGNNGFGYDPLFYLPQLGCTAAQLPPERKNEISHRGQAARKFARKLKEMLTRNGPP